MKNDKEGPYVKLGSGECLHPILEDSIPNLFENLHPEYNARATFYLNNKEWISVLGCVSEGFSISFKNAGQKEIGYCKNMLSVDDVHRILVLFLKRDGAWKNALPLGVQSRSARLCVFIIIICILGSILYLLVRDLLGWIK